MKRLCVLIVVVAGVCLLAGCATGGETKRPPLHPMLLDPAALDDLTTAYSDRYVLLVSAATDSIQARTTDLRQRHLAQKLKTESAVSVYDIVTSGDSYGRLLDLTVAVTLQSEVYIDEDGAEHDFGRELAPPLIRALRQARIEIWNIAAKALTSEQLDNLDLLIVDFRRSNPTLPNVINIRFNDFANSKTKSLVADASAGGIFSQIDEARRSVDEARRLAERAFFYGKRAPLLLSWQLETNADDMLSKPEFVQFLDDLHRFGTLAENLPGVIAGEREAILAAFDERQKTLGETLKSTRETLAEADTVVKSGQQTLQEVQRTTAALDTLLHSADTVAMKYMPPPTTQATSTQSAGVAMAPAPPPHPFDVREYTETLAQATAAIKELEHVLTSSQSLLASPAWTARITELQKTADGRVRLAETQSETLVSSIFVRVYIAIGALFVALVAYRLVSLMLTRRMLHAQNEKRSA